MKLAPRIRKLEADTLQSLSTRLEAALKQIQRQREEVVETNGTDNQDQENQMNGHEVSIFVMAAIQAFCQI